MSDEVRSGRPEEEESRIIELKLLELLQANAENMKTKGWERSLEDPSVLRVLTIKEILDEINIHLKRKSFLKMTERSLQKRLQHLFEMGAVKRKYTKGKTCYYSVDPRSPRFFWKEILEPLLRKMKIDDGEFDFSAIPLAESQDPRGVLFQPTTTALLGTGTKFLTRTFKTSSTEKTRLFRRLSEAVECELQEHFKEVYKSHEGVDTAKQMMPISARKFRRIEQRLRRTKLAFVCVIDGSWIYALRIPA